MSESFTDEGARVDPPAGREELLARFERVERELELDVRRIDDVPWWDLARYPFHLALLRTAGMGGTDPLEGSAPVRSPRQLFVLMANLLRAFTVRSPARARAGGILIIGHPRRRFEDGHWQDLYVDPLLPLLPPEFDVAVLEDPIDFGHRTPAATPDLRYLDGLKLFARLAERRARGLTDAQRAEILPLEQRFSEAMGFEVALVAHVEDAMKRWRAHYPRYRAMLERVQPRCMLIVRSARQEALIAAAKSLGVPVAELQHGSPTRGKLNYDFSSGIDKSTFPDLFASFGPFWTSDIRLPVPAERIHDLGFAYLSAKRERYRDVVPRRQIVVLSQPDVAAALGEFCQGLVAILPQDVTLVYKPHPEETRRDDGAFSALRASGITVADDPRTDLYGLLAESRWQIGVYSTALYEGLAFGCACFIVRTSGHELMQPVVDMGLASYVDVPGEVDLEHTVDPGRVGAMFTAATAARAGDLIDRLIHLTE